MRDCEKIKGECRKKTDILESADDCGDKFPGKTTGCIMLGNNYRMKKISVPESKTKIIIVEEL